MCEVEETTFSCHVCSALDWQIKLGVLSFMCSAYHYDRSGPVGLAAACTAFSLTRHTPDVRVLEAFRVAVRTVGELTAGRAPGICVCRVGRASERARHVSASGKLVPVFAASDCDFGPPSAPRARTSVRQRGRRSPRGARVADLPLPHLALHHGPARGRAQRADLRPRGDLELVEAAARGPPERRAPRPVVVVPQPGAARAAPRAARAGRRHGRRARRPGLGRLGSLPSLGPIFAETAPLARARLSSFRSGATHVPAASRSAAVCAKSCLASRGRCPSPPRPKPCPPIRLAWRTPSGEGRRGLGVSVRPSASLCVLDACGSLSACLSLPPSLPLLPPCVARESARPVRLELSENVLALLLSLALSLCSASRLFP